MAENRLVSKSERGSMFELLCQVWVRRQREEKELLRKRRVSSERSVLEPRSLALSPLPIGPIPRIEDRTAFESKEHFIGMRLSR